jgi:hypothetical protein
MDTSMHERLFGRRGGDPVTNYLEAKVLDGPCHGSDRPAPRVVDVVIFLSEGEAGLLSAQLDVRIDEYGRDPHIGNRMHADRLRVVRTCLSFARGRSVLDDGAIVFYVDRAVYGALHAAVRDALPAIKEKLEDARAIALRVAS